ATGDPPDCFFDTGRARRYALELFACYGVPLQANARLASPAVMLDGFNAQYALGFVLREPVMQGGSDADSSHSLDEQHASELAAAGFFVQLSDPQIIQEGNDFVPVLAYLATLVGFLSAHTDGPDVDLSPSLWRVQQRFEMDASLPREQGFVKLVASATEP